MMTTEQIERDLLALPESSLWGEVVGWEVPTADVEWSAIRSALEAAELPVELAKELRPSTAFRRALSVYRKNRSIDKIERKGDVVRFQLTRKATHKELGASTELVFAREAWVSLHCETGEIRSDSESVEETAREMFAHCLAHRKPSDVTKLIQGMFASESDLFPLIPSKGVTYFVPIQSRDFTARVGRFLALLGGTLCRLPVPKGDEVGNQSVRDAVESGIAAMARELSEACEGWSDTTRESTMKKTLERWEKVRYKAEAYGEYLGEIQGRLLADLDVARARMRERMAELMSEGE